MPDPNEPTLIQTQWCTHTRMRKLVILSYSADQRQITPLQTRVLMIPAWYEAISRVASQSLPQKIFQSSAATGTARDQVLRPVQLASRRRHGNRRDDIHPTNPEIAADTTHVNITRGPLCADTASRQTDTK